LRDLQGIFERRGVRNLALFAASWRGSVPLVFQSARAPGASRADDRDADPPPRRRSREPRHRPRRTARDAPRSWTRGRERSSPRWRGDQTPRCTPRRWARRSGAISEIAPPVLPTHLGTTAPSRAVCRAVPFASLNAVVCVAALRTPARDGLGHVDLIRASARLHPAERACRTLPMGHLQLVRRGCLARPLPEAG
jgi:hypothetical protein